MLSIFHYGTVFVILHLKHIFFMIYPDSFEHKIGFTAVRRDVRAHCLSPLGAARVDDMTFMTHFPAMATELRRTAEMLAIISSNVDVPLHNIVDITRQLKEITVEGTFLPVADLALVRKALSAMSEVNLFFTTADDERPRYPELYSAVQGMATFKECITAIDRVIDRFGNVKDNASAELADIRQRLSSLQGTVSNVMRRVMAAAVKEGYLEADAAPAMRDGRLVLPVSPMYKRKINGIVHDESATGRTVFIEPAEVVEVNNRVRELEMEERREIIRILTATASLLRPHIPDMLDSSEVLGLIDFIHAKALYAADIDAHLPNISDKPELEYYHACHPGLLMSLRRQGKEVVPLDITLSEKDRILIISGPNAGGKSVCLKTVGIVQYMTQCGLLPPVYENSRMGMFDDIFVDIGDDQSIEDDLSTYSSHLRSMRLLVQKGRPTTLVLIDEFGGGTEPQIGGALAQAILKRLNEKRMWGVITTHYQNLKHFAEDTDGLINGSMLYDRQLMQPLFRLSIGNPGSSFAVEIARKIGLPADIIADAEAIVGSDYINMDRYLLDIARDRRYWENKRTAIRQKEKKLEQTLERYNAEADELREKRREILSEAKEEAKKILSGSNAAIERTIHEIRRSQADREQTLQARRELEEVRERLDSGNVREHELLKKAPRKRRKPESADAAPAAKEKPIAVGDTVKLDGEGVPGKVVEISGSNATVVFGMLKTTVKTSRLRHTMARIDSGASKASSFVSSSTADDMRRRQLEFSQDIDIRGMRVDEAVQAVTYFIDDALQFNAKRVRILHGTGTGALRQYVRRYLNTVPGVKSYRDEHVQFGGAGITIVDLE